MNDDPIQVPLNAILDSWDLHNALMIRLLQLLPPGGLAARATDTSPTVSEMFTHMHHERMVSVQEEAPEVAPLVPRKEWDAEPDVRKIEEMLVLSGAAVRTAVKGRIAAGRALDESFLHPVTLIHFLTFHEGYHHGQVKLALKVRGLALSDDVVGPEIWGRWRTRG